MNVKLVSITKSLVEGKEMSAEELLVYIARVSNPSNQMNVETSDKLIGYLIKHKHWSPFDMVHLCVSVTTSKAVGIQILRHWSLDVQEFSQRYAATNRQVGDEVFNPQLTIRNNVESFHMEADNAIQLYLEEGTQLYKSLLEAGVAKECARMVLPMATSTTMYLNGSIRSWIFYLEQRTSQHAQKEHRDVAKLVEAIFKEQFPMTSKALNI
jgi:thymidylate synthase (FAD)